MQFGLRRAAAFVSSPIHLFWRRQLSRWIAFSWTWPIYDWCLVQVEEVRLSRRRGRTILCDIQYFAKSLKIIENGTVHRSRTRSYSSSIITMAVSCIFYSSFSSVTLDTITHVPRDDATLHLRRYCRADSPCFSKWNEILVETRQFLIPLLPLNLNVDITPWISIQNFNTNCPSP